MKRYLYNYQTTVSFTAPVRAHSVLLRCLPALVPFQNVEQECFLAPPDFKLRRSTDAFGNRIIYGGQRGPHQSWVYVSAGIVSVGDYEERANPADTFLFTLPSRLTTAPPLDDLPPLTGKSADMAMQVCRHVNATMSYVPCATTVETTAAQVAAARQGVCQDYAHLMIAYLRQMGIAARYVCGFLEGQGQTHAWVEVFDGYAWRGFDPTHCRPVESGYVKLAHGRDAADCPVSRGNYVGQAIQQTEINVTLKEI